LGTSHHCGPRLKVCRGRAEGENKSSQVVHLMNKEKPDLIAADHPSSITSSIPTMA
jgi:hypothetical protein